MPNNFTTYPNQKIIVVHRETPKENFLGIKNENWMAASRDLTPHSMMLYFYFAANKDNYQFAFSPEAVLREIGIAKSTCHDQIKNLINKGYLVPKENNSNIYDFYEKPIRITTKEDAATANSFYCAADELCCTNDVQSNPPENIEINNNYLTDNLINNSPKTEQAQFSVATERYGTHHKLLEDMLKRDEFIF